VPPALLFRRCPAAAVVTSPKAPRPTPATAQTLPDGSDHAPKRVDSMKTVSSVLLVLRSCPCRACAPKVNEPADMQAVSERWRPMPKHPRQGRLPLRLHDDGQTAFFEPHFPAMTGKDAVVKFLTMAFEQFDVEMIRRHRRAG